MKRSLILLSGILVVLSLGTPYVLGILAEKNIHNILTTIDEKANNDGAFANVSFSDINIQRGWFSSTATIKGKVYAKNTSGIILESLTSGFKKSGNEFTIDLNVYHGPLLFIYDANSKDKLGLALVHSQINLAIKSSTSEVESLPIKLKSSISYLGKFNHSLELPTHKQRVNSIFSFNCLNLDLDFYHSGDFSEYELDLDLDDLQIMHILFGKVIIKGINLHKSYSTRNKGSHSSRMFLADEISLVSINGKELFLDELSQEMVVSVDQKDLSDIYMSMGVNSLRGVLGKYGPAFIGFNWKHFNLKPFSEFIQKMYDKELDLSAGILFDNVGKSVTKNSSIELHPLKFTSGSGDLVVNGVVNLKYPWPKDLQSVKNVWELTEKVNFNLSASKELTKHMVRYIMILEKRKKLLSKADHTKSKKYLKSQKIQIKDDIVIQKINEWEKAGLLTLDNKDYKLKFNFANNSFDFNGHTL